MTLRLPRFAAAGIFGIAVLVTAPACTSATSSSISVQPHPSTASSLTTGSPPTVELRCADAIGAYAAEEQSSVVLGVVGLPASPRYWALQTTSSGSADPTAKLFAKTGLTIKVGATFTITVPPEYADVARIGWGNPAVPTTSLSVNACPDSYSPGATWLNYSGGYYVARPMCLPLTIDSGGQKREVSIGVGTPCPGQRAVPSA